MRLARLDLIRFGHFTDRSLELSRSSPDLHIVHGPNEAGKTTTMNAIEDLLFGIPIRSPYDFRHEYRAMRLGALLEDGAARMEVLRRKGSKDTLLAPDGSPVPRGELDLARMLGGAGPDFRAFFERMFNLGHGRLVRGGRAILAAEGEIGEALVAAGSGLTELRSLARAAKAEAESLWAPRRSKARAFYQAHDRQREVERRLSENLLRPPAWKKLEVRRRDAERKLQEARERHEAAAREARKRSRIRRVVPDLRRRAEVERRVAAMGDVPDLPPDAAARLPEAERRMHQANAQLVQLREDLNARREELGDIRIDSTLLEREQEIGRLRKRGSAIADMRQKGLPKREEELRTLERALRRKCPDLGWGHPELDQILERFPPQAKVSRARELLQERAALDQARKGVEAALLRARQRKEQLSARQVTDARPALDGHRLRAAVQATERDADLESRIRRAHDRVVAATDHLANLTASLRPAVPHGVAPAALPVPDIGEVKTLRDRFRTVETDLQHGERQLRDRRSQLGRQTRHRDRIHREERVHTDEDLRRARERRDELWRGLKNAGSGSDVSTTRLAPLFEEAMRETDDMADRRVAHAEAAARLTGMDREIRRLEEEVAADAEVCDGLRTEIRELQLRWASLWEGSPFPPGSPERMLAWMDTRERILEGEEALQHAQRDVASLREADRAARRQLRDVLVAWGVDAGEVESDRLPVLIRRAGQLRQDDENRRRQEGETRQAIEAAAGELEQAEGGVRAATRALRKIELRWKEALAELGLVPGDASVANDQIGILEGMREDATEARQIRDTRIKTMKREIDRFESELSDFAARVTPDLSRHAPDDAVSELERRVGEAREARTAHARVSREIEQLEEKIREARREKRKAELTLAPLFETAGTTDMDALRDAIERSDRLRELTAERDAVLRRLTEGGDGLTLEELEAEAADIHPDEVRAAEAAADAARKAASEEVASASGDLASATHSMQSLGGDDGAAVLRTRREEARSHLRAVAERYARVGTTAILLQWALERFGREKRVPMLQRAGELFRILTAGSFARLTLDFDDTDQMRVHAERPNGEMVAIPGLSSGTEDQLFLALRIAYIEDYVSKRPALPFVADDLFLNFDDERAAGGFRALGELAKRTQVLFFTHHEHLLEIASEALGPDLPITRLAPAREAVASPSADAPPSGRLL